MPITKKYLGREIKEEHSFKINGTFQSLYDAQSWCYKNGYSYGSMSKDEPIALKYGPYDLPQKWKNFDNEEIALIDGVIISNDFREGEVIIFIFN